MLKAILISLIFQISFSSGGGNGSNLFIAQPAGRAVKVQEGIVTSIRMRLDQAAQMRESDVRQAIESAEIALDHALVLDSARLIGECYLSLGLSYDYLGARPEALNYLNMALGRFSASNHHKLAAEAMRQIGYVYYYSNEFLLALDWFEKVYRLGTEKNDTALLIAGGIGRGQVYGNISEMDSAAILFKEAYLLAKKSGDKETEVQSLFYSGDVLLYSRKPDLALEVYKKVLVEYELRIVNPKIITSLYNSVSNAAIETGRYSEAKVYNKLAFESLTENSKLQHREDYYFNKFRLDTIFKDFNSALIDYRMYKTYYDSSYNSKFRRDLANIRIIDEMRYKESEIERLKNEGMLKDLKIKQRKIVNWGSILLILLISLILYQQWRTSVKIRAKNRRLEEQQEELEAAFLNLKNTHKQLLQSEKMASLGLLASGVAHEINNPLNYIYGGVQCIKNYCNEANVDCPPEMETYLRAINSGIEKVSAIVNGLHRFSPGKEMRLRDVNLNSVADTCLLMLNHMTSGKIEIVKDYKCTDCITRGDEPQLHQVVLSVLLNAIQSISGSGRIEISTWKKENKSCIKITDSGHGIKKENLPFIFDPFYTTKDPGQGTGLGLSITYNIITDHKGTIEVESEPAHGTSFTICLPSVSN